MTPNLCPGLGWEWVGRRPSSVYPGSSFLYWASVLILWGQKVLPHRRQTLGSEWKPLPASAQEGFVSKGVERGDFRGRGHETWSKIGQMLWPKPRGGRAWPKFPREQLGNWLLSSLDVFYLLGLLGSHEPSRVCYWETRVRCLPASCLSGAHGSAESGHHVCRSRSLSCHHPSPWFPQDTLGFLSYITLLAFCPAVLRQPCLLCRTCFFCFYTVITKLLLLTLRVTAINASVYCFLATVVG